MIQVYKEKAGVISKEPIWVCFVDDCYMYDADTLWELFKLVIREYKHDKHLVG